MVVLILGRADRRRSTIIKDAANSCKLVSFVLFANLAAFVAMENVLKMASPRMPFEYNSYAHIDWFNLRRRVRRKKLIPTLVSCRVFTMSIGAFSIKTRSYLA